MRTFWDWVLKTLTGALIVCFFLAVGGPYVFPITLPLLAFGGEELVLGVADAAGLVVVVWLAASILYTIGFGIWWIATFLWAIVRPDNNETKVE